MRQSDEQIKHRDGCQNPERSSERDVKKELRGKKAKHQPDHSQHKIRDRLTEQDFIRWTGVTKSASMRAALPFARHDHRGEQSADERHDQNNQTGDEKVMAVVGFVEPEPVLHHDRARSSIGRPPAACAPPSVPPLACA